MAPAHFCRGSGYSTDASDLNLPSIGIAELAGEQTIRRTVTNVSSKRGRYTATARKPAGYRVKIRPQTLVLDPGQSATFEVTITNESAPPGEWRFGRLVWRDASGKFEVASKIAVRAKAVIAPEELSETGSEGSTSFDVTFGYNGAYAAGAHGLELPLLWADTVPDDPGNSFEFLGPGTSIAYLWETTPGALTAKWALYDAYIDGNHDFDMYVYYCPDFFCTLVGFSAGFTSEESVRINNPVNDPTIDDPYLVLVHAYETEGGQPASYIHFDWTDPAVGPDLGNMTVERSVDGGDPGHGHDQHQLGGPAGRGRRQVPGRRVAQRFRRHPGADGARHSTMTRAAASATCSPAPEPSPLTQRIRAARCSGRPFFVAARQSAAMGGQGIVRCRSVWYV